MSVMLSHIDYNPQDADEEEFEREDAQQQEELKAFLDNELDDNDLFDDTFAMNEKSQFNTHLSMRHNDIPPGDDDNYFDASYAEAYVANNKNVDYHNALNNKEVTQLRVLYNARGKRIVELERLLEERVEEKEKELRVTQHKLTMSTSEFESARVSIEQLKQLLNEHKQENNTLCVQVQSEQEQCRLLNNELNECNEKLFASNAAVDSLQLQIRELNQSESLAKTRSHHESMLASLRQKHEEAILFLKEKLDDVQQRLAWKTEDVSRYKELLESNSSSSEIGMLRHRLTTSENENKELQHEIETCQKQNIELEDQLHVYDGLLKTSSGQASSTPINTAILHMNRGKLDFKTPVSRLSPLPESPLAATDHSLRGELVKALSSNREKRAEIQQLHDEIALFKTGDTSIAAEERRPESICFECDKKTAKMEEMRSSMGELKNERQQLKNNMVQMVKDFDREKTNCLEKQNTAMIQLIDDAKKNVRDELSCEFDARETVFKTEIERLDGELLFAREEYNKLCTEMKSFEKHFREESSVEKRVELEEVTKDLEEKYKENLEVLQNKLTSAHVEELEKEKRKWKEEEMKERELAIENALTLAKVTWCHEKDELRSKTNEVISAREKCEENYSKEIEGLKKKQKQDLCAALASQKLLLDSEYCKKEEGKIEELCRKHELKEQELQQLIQHANKEIRCLTSKCASDKSLHEKSEIDFKLQISLLKSKDSDLLRKIQILEEEPVKREHEVDKSQTSVMFEELLVDGQNEGAEENDAVWKCREKELLLLLDETRAKLQKALDVGHTDVSPMTESFKSMGKLTDEWLAKETNYKREIFNLRETMKKCEEEAFGSCWQLEKEKNIVNQVEKELVTAKETLKGCEADLAIEREMKTALEFEKNRLENEMKAYIASLLEKEKMQQSATALCEESLKAEGQCLKERVLRELNSEKESDLMQKMSQMKVNHESEVNELKHGFRQKLDRISEMKKKWLLEEQQKRGLVEERLQKEFVLKENRWNDDRDKMLAEQRQRHEHVLKSLQEATLRLEESLVVKDENFKKLKDEHAKEKQNLINEHQSTLERLASTNQIDIEAERTRLTAQYEGIIEKKIREMEANCGQRAKEAYEKGMLQNVPEDQSDSVRKIRAFYLDTVRQLNDDVRSHVKTMHENAANQIREAAKRERRNLLRKIKEKSSKTLSETSDRQKPHTRHASQNVETKTDDKQSDKKSSETLKMSNESDDMSNNVFKNNDGKYPTRDNIHGDNLTRYKIDSGDPISCYNINVDDPTRRYSPDGLLSLESTLLSMADLPVNLTEKR